MSAKKPRLAIACRHCSAAMLVSERQIKAGRGRFCSRSCGVAHNATRHGHAAGTQSPTYNSWASMLQRCTNPRATKWPSYGGQGVTVCARWHEFANFLADMGERPAGKTLDRIDNAAGYEPKNCRWATNKQQQQNLRANKLVDYEGRQYVLSALADLLQIDKATLAYRIRQEWPPSLWGISPGHGNRAKLRGGAARE